MGRRSSTRVHEGRKVLEMKSKARTVVGRGEESLLRDPGSELRLIGRREKKERRCSIGWKQEKNKTKQQFVPLYIVPVEY